METAKKKAIQKRVQRRERFARMARIRYRKERNALIANVQDIIHPLTPETQESVYEGPLGINIAETDQGLDADISLLNATYLSNSINIVNDKSKLLCVKLQKTSAKYKAMPQDKVNEWEQRSDPYWIKEAKKGKQFAKLFPEFMEKNKEKFESNKVDEQSINRYKVHAAKRDELMSRKDCCELRIKFNSKEAGCSEIIFTSGFVSRLNYGFEEFIQKILIEGLPRMHPNCLDYKRLEPELEGVNFDNVFENTYELRFPEKVFLAKDSSFTKTGFTIMFGGYFVKNFAEISAIVALDDDRSFGKNGYQNKFHRLYIEQQLLNDLQRKTFLETFYPTELAKVLEAPRQVCGIRSLLPEDQIEEEMGEQSSEGVSTTVKSEENNSSVCMRKDLVPPPSMQNLPFNQFLSHAFQNQQSFWSFITQQRF